MKTSTTIPFAATVLLMAATLAGAWVTDQRSTVTPLARPLDQIPATLAGWSMTADEPLEATVLEQLKPTTYISRIYGNGARRLGLLIVYYAQQRAGESMHSPEHCLPGGGWQIRGREIESLPLAGRTVGVNRYAIAHAGENDVMYYWYQSQRRVIAAARDYLAQRRGPAKAARFDVIAVVDGPDGPALTHFENAFDAGP